MLTGRQYASARPYIEQLEIDLPSSTNHGARVRDRAGNEIRRVLMPGSFADQLLADYLHDHLMDFSAVMDDTLYVRDPDSDKWEWVHASSRSITHYRAGAALEYDKVVFQSNHMALSLEVEQRIGQSYPTLHRYLWGDGFLEVVPEGADKGSALEFIAGQLGVPRSEVVAFGDGANDITMIDWAGTGVAVGPGRTARCWKWPKSTSPPRRGRRRYLARAQPALAAQPRSSSACRNSWRVRASSRKVPRMALVRVVDPCFSTPRIIMHM